MNLNVSDIISFHTQMHIDRCANICWRGKKWHPHRVPAHVVKGSCSHLLIRHVLQRFATQFCTCDEFEDDWNTH